MTPSEYRAVLERLDLDQSAAGRFFNVHEVTGRRWAAVGPPPPVAKMLRLMMALQFTPDYVDKVIGETR